MDQVQSQCSDEATSDSKLPPIRKCYSPLGKLRPECKSGFRHMELSINRILQKVTKSDKDHSSESTLDDKWDQVGCWIDRYTLNTEADQLCNICTTLLRNVKSKYSDTVPNYERTSIACVLLEQLFHILGRSHPRLIPCLHGIYGEVLASIFSVTLYGLYNHVSHSDGFFVLTTTDDHDVSELQSRLPRKPFFKLLRERAVVDNINRCRQEDLEQIKFKQSRVLCKAISFWQNHVLRLLFHGWREGIARENTNALNTKYLRSLTEQQQKTDDHFDKILRTHETEMETLSLELCNQKQLNTSLSEELLSEKQTNSQLKDRIEFLENQIASQRIVFTDTLKREEQCRQQISEYKELIAGSKEDVTEIDSIYTKLEEGENKMISLKKTIGLLTDLTVDMIPSRNYTPDDCLRKSQHMTYMSQFPNPEVSYDEILFEFILQSSDWFFSESDKAALRQTGIAPGPHLLCWYLATLHHIAPMTLSREAATELLQNCGPDDVNKALIHSLRTLSILVETVSIDLLSSNVLHHRFCLSLLFWRFSEPRPTTGNPTSRIQPKDSSPEQLRKQWEERIETEMVWIAVSNIALRECTVFSQRLAGNSN